MQPNFTIHIHLPLLDAYLVEYLKEQDTTQAKVNALAATITNLTGQLRTSTADLKAAVNAPQ